MYMSKPKRMPNARKQPKGPHPKPPRARTFESHETQPIDIDFPSERYFAPFNQTPPVITPEVIAFCKLLNPEAGPVYLVPTSTGEFRYCHSNVLKLVRKHGGEILSGRTILQKGLPPFLEAIYHSI